MGQLVGLAAGRGRHCTGRAFQIEQWAQFLPDYFCGGGGAADVGWRSFLSALVADSRKPSGLGEQSRQTCLLDLIHRPPFAFA